MNQSEPLITTRTVSPEEMEELIYKGNTVPEDRFRRHDDGGVFKLFYPEDTLYPRFRNRIHYSIVEKENTIVAIGKLSKAQEGDNVYELSSVSVDPKYQDEGYARKLLEEMFCYAKTNDWTLVTSSYTKDGWEKLKDMVHELANEMDVPVIDAEEKMFRENSKQR